MFKNYIITAWRNIARYKLLAAINVFGLSLGISACLVIFLIARFELSFDNYHPGKERIFRIVSDRYSPEYGEEHSGNIPVPAPFAIRGEIAGIETLAVFHNDYMATVTIRDSSLPEKRFAKPPFGEEQHSDIVLTEPQYFDIFHYDWLAGNAAVLKEPYTVVLTQSKARQYFGEHAAAELINKTIIYNDSLNIRVAGIVKDPAKNTDFNFTDFISFNTLKKGAAFESWNDGYTSAQVFVKLANGVPPSRINASLADLSNRHYKQTGTGKTTWLLQPLSTIHFDARYGDTYSRKVHLPTLYILMGIALFILVLAVINFITLSTAQSIDRAKETGIRKICGSTVSGLVLRFLGETSILTGLALALAIAGIYPLLAVLRPFIPEGVSFSFFSFSNWVFVLAVGLFTTLLAGIYPAKVLSSSVPAINLKGAGMQTWNRRGYFIKGLIIFQFTISMVFIICNLVTGNQMQYMLNKDLGFTKDAILTVQTNPDHGADKKQALAEKIRKLPEVAAVSLSEGTPLAKRHFFNPLIYKGKEERGTACILEWADEHFSPLYDIKIIAGRNIQPCDTIKEFLVNESCTRALGFTKPEDAVGKMVETIMPGRVLKRPIIGVMADFHSQSLHEPIKPVFLTTSASFTRLINIKLNTGEKQLSHFKETVLKIEKCWKEVYPNDPFDYTFFDEMIGKFYEKERQTSRLLVIALVVSISISCLGLFGLATLTARRRAKEIGIRKVLGAGIEQIVFVLSKDTIQLVLIAIAIASPMAWYGMNRWLNSFAFRIAINGWQFVLAGAIALFIAFCAISYQSVKAAFMNPVAALRSE
ncbi:ABC transporter permease [Longitalea luteola]|uniref:ABC transporter permease n=1 Tax=Longitalea luteola TaxID=2812563 RepID=UPI001A9750DD|nr:ABC transporter permease [Longitalea luteola]